MTLNKTCSFFGHRNANLNEQQIIKLKHIIEDLIVNQNVKTFLFGSRSNFDSLCHSIITELKEKYIDIKRIAYTCRSETCILESEKTKWEQIYSNLYKRKVDLLGVEEEFEHKTKYTSGKASYVERNQAMIDNSDICIIYYKEDYKPNIRKQSKRSIGYYQPKSGTKLAHEYIKQKKKDYINIA